MTGWHPGAASLSALVCAYTLDRWPDLVAAVESLRLQTRRPEQVIVVSDHNPALLERARRAFPDALCLANEGASGLSGARNTGVRAASSDVIAFLDDDAAAAPDWAARLLDPYSDPDVIGVGGRVRPHWLVPRPRWLPDEFLWTVGCSYAGQPEMRAEVRNPIGASMSFRRTLFEAVGGFDPEVGRIGADAAGCEETEFCIRARKRLPGSRVVIEPAALCEHTVPAARATRVYFRRRCRAEGRSKAVVGRLQGGNVALSSERAYLSRTLPRAFAREVRALVRGDPGGAARAWSILEGTALTSAAYLVTRLRLALPQPPQARTASG